MLLGYRKDELTDENENPTVLQADMQSFRVVYRTASDYRAAEIGKNLLRVLGHFCRKVLIPVLIETNTAAMPASYLPTFRITRREVNPSLTASTVSFIPSTAFLISLTVA